MREGGGGIGRAGVVGRGGEAFAQGAAGVEEAGFHRAEGGGGDLGDGFEREIFEEMENEDGALGRRQFVDEGEEGGGLFGAEETVARIGREVVGRDGQGGVVEGFFAAGAAPLLDDFLVGDAEEPGAEAGVVAQGAEVAMGGDEGVLDDVESGGLVAEEFPGVGEERELVTVEQGPPRGAVTGAGGGDVDGEIGGGVGDGAGHRAPEAGESGA